MKISVIIPTYKPKEYLWECLDSLVKQTFPKKYFEVILVLNGCTEPWKNEIENYIATEMQGMNVNFIHTEQGGVSNARNIALDKAKGEYVTFIDDDDFISLTYLEELYEIVTPQTVALSYAYAFNDGDFGKQLPYVMTDAYEYCIERGCNTLSSKVRKFFSGPCMKLIPMSFIQGRRYDVRFKNGEDSLFMFLISDKINKVSFTSKEAIYYRRYRENSAYTSKQKRSYLMKNEFLRICEYSKIYFSFFGKYHTEFYITRVLAALKSMFV